MDPDGTVSHVNSEPVAVTSPAPSFIEDDAAGIAASVLSTVAQDPRRGALRRWDRSTR